MPILDSYGGAPALLSNAQTGNGDSTDTAVRAVRPNQPGAIVITSVVGATPTVTVNIMGSVDGTNFYNIPYALVATPETVTVAAITITTAVTTVATPETVTVAAITITTAVTTTYLLRPGHPWKYVKLVLSANTNVTLTATAYL